MIEKLNIEINGTTMEFSQNGEKIEFDIPQRALKLLCNYVYEAHSEEYSTFNGVFDLDVGNYEKELYPNGTLKSLTQKNHFVENYGWHESENDPRECMAKYEFDENHKLTSFNTKYSFSDYDNEEKKEVTISNLSYFKNSDEKRVKGEITGFDFGISLIESGEYSSRGGFSFEEFCNTHIDFFNVDVDVKEVEAREFKLETSEQDQNFELNYDNCGVLNNSLDGDYYGGLNGGDYTKNGKFEQYIIGKDGYALEFIKNYGEEDGFYKINMYYRDFVVLFWDIIDVDCSQDENDDIISIDDEVYENIIKIKGYKLFGFTNGWIADDESDDYDVESYEIEEDDCLEEDLEMKYIKTIDLLINKNYFEKFFRYIIFDTYSLPREAYSPIVMF